MLRESESGTKNKFWGPLIDIHVCHFERCAKSKQFRRGSLVGIYVWLYICIRVLRIYIAAVFSFPDTLA